MEGTYALAEIDNEQVIPYMTASLSRGTYMNRLKAIEALGRYPGDLVARSLLIALRDPDEAVRREAGQVLRRLDGIENIFVILGNQTRRGTATERRVAVEALAVTRDRRALPFLMMAIEDESPGVREAAVHGIGMLGFRDADVALKDAIKSEDIGMRLAGMRGWGELYVSVRVEWLTDVLRQIRREGLEESYLAATLQILHRRSGHYGASALLSLVDFSDPDPRNTWNRQILRSAEAIKGVPRLMAEYAPDRGRRPSERDIETNRKILEGYEQWYRAHPLP
jgi:HEAT repeat protein